MRRVVGVAGSDVALRDGVAVFCVEGIEPGHQGVWTLLRLAPSAVVRG